MNFGSRSRDFLSTIRVTLSMSSSSKSSTPHFVAGHARSKAKGKGEEMQKVVGEVVLRLEMMT